VQLLASSKQKNRQQQAAKDLQKKRVSSPYNFVGGRAARSAAHFLKGLKKLGTEMSPSAYTRTRVLPVHAGKTKQQQQQQQQQRRST
jgi:hypothetical protein